MLTFFWEFFATHGKSYATRDFWVGSFLCTRAASYFFTKILEKPDLDDPPLKPLLSSFLPSTRSFFFGSSTHEQLRSFIFQVVNQTPGDTWEESEGETAAVLLVIIELVMQAR